MADEQYDFVVSGPVWMIVGRDAPTTEFLVGNYGGSEYLVMFTDSDLAYRYFEQTGKPASMLIGALDTPQDFISFLERAERNGCENLGFDPDKNGKPLKILSLRTVLDSARKEFGQESP